jgi:hypothetical protein
MASFITIALLGISSLLKRWFSKGMQTYILMMGVDNSNLWIINFVIDMALNLPEKIHNIFVADITHCYEAIPL